jgi:hypothetical protein
MIFADIEKMKTGCRDATCFHLWMSSLMKNNLIYNSLIFKGKNFEKYGFISKR